MDSTTSATAIDPVLSRMGELLGTPIAGEFDVDALLHDQALMSMQDLDWAAAFEEQRAAALPEIALAPISADVDLDALLADVSVDANEALREEAMAEQRAAEQAGNPAGEVDADSLLEDVKTQQSSWRSGALAAQVVRYAEHEGLVARRAA